jgi:hypothetical protein
VRRPYSTTEVSSVETSVATAQTTIPLGAVTTAVDESMKEPSCIYFQVGDTVHVLTRSYPGKCFLQHSHNVYTYLLKFHFTEGINKQGGAARIVDIHINDEDPQPLLYDVKYILTSQTEKNVEPQYILKQEFLTRSSRARYVRNIYIYIYIYIFYVHIYIKIYIVVLHRHIVSGYNKDFFLHLTGSRRHRLQLCIFVQMF